MEYISLVLVKMKVEDTLHYFFSFSCYFPLFSTSFSTNHIIVLFMALFEVSFATSLFPFFHFIASRLYVMNPRVQNGHAIVVSSSCMQAKMTIFVHGTSTSYRASAVLITTQYNAELRRGCWLSFQAFMMTFLHSSFFDMKSWIRNVYIQSSTLIKCSFSEGKLLKSLYLSHKNEPTARRFLHTFSLFLLRLLS